MIGIIAAMDSEVEAIETLLEHKELKHLSGIKMIQGTIKNKRVMVLKSGVGKCCYGYNDSFRELSHRKSD